VLGGQLQWLVTVISVQGNKVRLFAFIPMSKAVHLLETARSGPDTVTHVQLGNADMAASFDFNRRVFAEAAESACLTTGTRQFQVGVGSRRDGPTKGCFIRIGKKTEIHITANDLLTAGIIEYDTLGGEGKAKDVS